MHSDLIHWSVNIIVTANRLHCRIVSDRIAAGRSVSRHVLIKHFLSLFIYTGFPYQ